MKTAFNRLLGLTNMKISSNKEVRELYEDSADTYNKMIDNEIDLPVYSDLFGRLFKKISELTGAVIDTSCGSGHMLYRYCEKYDPQRPLIGIDLSPSMVALASQKLGSNAIVYEGDMRDLSRISPGSVAAVISFYAMHHLDSKGIDLAFKEWFRTLCLGGQLFIATWEGKGPIDYGGESDVVALRYSKEEVATWATNSGFRIDRLVVETVEEIPMEVIYLEATKV